MTDGERPQDDDATLARAVRGAAPRAAASPEARARAFTAVQAAWREAVAAPQAGAAGTAAPAAPAAPAPAIATPPPPPAATVRRWPLALAASLALVALGAGLAWRAREDAPTLAVAELVRGPVQRAQPGWLGAQLTALAPRAALVARDTLASGDSGGALLRLGPGLTLRLAARSRLAFDAAGRVTLEAGMVYVDADPARGRQPLEVGTRWGVVSHLGTQYAIGADDTRLELAVREGSVRLVRDGAAPLEARAGELLRVAASGAVRRESLAPDDPRWAWLAALPASFDTDGATLAAFLAWYARETGREVVFADAADAERGAAVRIGGSIAGLAPEQALDVVAAATGLGVRREAARVVLDLP